MIKPKTPTPTPALSPEDQITATSYTNFQEAQKAYWAATTERREGMKIPAYADFVNQARAAAVPAVPASSTAPISKND